MSGARAGKPGASSFRRFAIGLVCAWLAVFAAFPNVLTLIVSFLTRSETDIVQVTPTLGNYLRLFDPIYFGVLASSAGLAAAASLLCLILGYPFAYHLARRVRRRRRQFLLLLVIIPFWTSSLIRTYALIILLKANGLINTALLALGLINDPLPLLYNDGAVLLGLVYTLLPFMILPLYAAMEKFDGRLLEAASDLGATRFQAFVRVTLPLTTPGIVAGCLLTFLPAMGMFYVADILGGAKSLLVGNLIKDQFLTARDWPFGAAASVVLFLAMVCLLIIYYRSARRTQAEAIL